jgi:hypothetical protein
MNIPTFYNWAASQSVAFLRIFFDDAKAKALAAESPAAKVNGAVRSDKPLTLSEFSAMAETIVTGEQSSPK